MLTLKSLLKFTCSNLLFFPFWWGKGGEGLEDRGWGEVLLLIFSFTHFVLADGFLDVPSAYYSPKFSKNFNLSFHIVIFIDIGHKLNILKAVMYVQFTSIFQGDRRTLKTCNNNMTKVSNKYTETKCEISLSQNQLTKTTSLT